MAEVERQQPVTLDFSQGLNEARQVELLEPRGFTRLENVRQRKKGAVSKRFGFGSFTSARMGLANRSTANRVYAYANSHAVIDDTGLDLYSASANAYRNVGRLPEVQATRDAVATVSQYDISTGLFYADAGIAAGYGGLEIIIHVRNDGTATPARYVYATVYDPTENLVVMQATLVAVVPATGGILQYPQVVVADGRAHVIYQDTAVTTDLYARTLDMRSAAGIAAGFAAAFKITDTTSGSLTSFDACSTGGKWVVAYATSGTVVRVRLWNADGTINTSTNITTGAGADAVSVGGSDGGILWLARRATGTTIRVQGLNPASLAVAFSEALVLTQIGTITAFHVIEAPGSTLAAPLGLLVTTSSSASQATYSTFRGTAGAVAFYGTVGAARNVHHASRPWFYGGRVYCAFTLMAASAAPFHRVLFVADITESLTAASSYGNLRPVATFAPRLIATLQTDYVIGSGFVQVGRPCVRSATRVAIPITVQRNSVACTVQMAQLDYASTGRWERADASDGLHLSCGTPTYFDGQICAEENFLASPYIDPLTITADGSGFSAPAPTGVGYAAVWEWTDALGNVHRSGLSNIVQSGAIAATSRVDVPIQLNYATNRTNQVASFTPQNPVWAAIYRTENGGVTFYRCGAIEVNGTGKNVTFTDKMQDSALRIREKLYRQPGETIAVQPHACPPSFTTCIAYSDRVWGVADDQRTLWFSAKRVPGEGTWFADLFQLSLELEGPITALGTMDGRLFVFKKRAIYTIDGDGPSDGGDGEFDIPVRVTSDVGCVSQRSVVYCPLGLMFQSVRGIEILSRAGSVEWVGESVQDTLDAYPTITSAVCQESTGVVLFTCSNGTAGVTIVWDYLNQTWSVDKVADAPNAQTQAIATHATIDGDGAYLRAHASGVIWRESTTSYRDGTAWVTMLAEFPWLKTSGLLGEQDIPRVMVLAQRGDHHGMQIRAGYNYSATYETILEQEPEDIDAVVATEGRELFDAFLTQAKTTSLRVEISDSETEDTAGPYASTSGQGPTWIGVVVMVQGRPGAGRTAKESR